jgi:hypothetical protein
MKLEVTDSESMLREMAAENQVARRQLAKAIVELRSRPFPGKRNFYARTIGGRIQGHFFLILVFRGKPGQDPDEYRQYRRTLLILYAKVTTLRFPTATQVVALGFSPVGGVGEANEDIVRWQPESWALNDIEKTKELAAMLGISMQPVVDQLVDWDFDPQKLVTAADRKRNRNQRKRERKARR